MAVGVVILWVMLAIGLPLALYVLVRSEHDQREAMDRQSAEQAARQDTDE